MLNIKIRRISFVLVAIVVALTLHNSTKWVFHVLNSLESVFKECFTYKVSDSSSFLVYSSSQRGKSLKVKKTSRHSDSQSLLIGVKAFDSTAPVVYYAPRTLPYQLLSDELHVHLGKRTHSSAAGLHAAVELRIPLCAVWDLRIDTSGYSEVLLGLKWSTSF